MRRVSSVWRQRRVDVDVEASASVHALSPGGVVHGRSLSREQVRGREQDPAALRAQYLPSTLHYQSFRPNHSTPVSAYSIAAQRHARKNTHTHVVVVEGWLRVGGVIDGRGGGGRVWGEETEQGC